MKRLLDILASFFGLLALSPILIAFAFLVWLHDQSSPFYIAPRVGRHGVPFPMVKLRSMTVGADKSGVDSTGDNDCRITPIGKLVRKYKIDELMQLWNVLIGQMSFVGPRPNVERETNLYTPIERGLLSVKPGITDFASIVFADEGKILRDCSDPDLSYHQLVRPGKSALGLFYVANRNLSVDLMLVIFTVLSLGSRRLALRLNSWLLHRLGAPSDLLFLSSRISPLVPSPPPGSELIVTSRDGSVPPF